MGYGMRLRFVRIFLLMMLKCILANLVLGPSMEDQWCWHLSPGGRYSTSSTYTSACTVVGLPRLATSSANESDRLVWKSM